MADRKKRKWNTGNIKSVFTTTKKTKYSGTTCNVYCAPENLRSNNVKTCIAILISIPRDKKCPFTG